MLTNRYGYTHTIGTVKQKYRSEWTTDRNKNCMYIYINTKLIYTYNKIMIV